MTTKDEVNTLGTYLKDRRTKMDPGALGFPMSRRRTPGLRREEVAQRANVSTTWYTWLEQGRGGAPSDLVLDRIAGALMLTDTEREHVYLLALGRPPEVKYKASDGITPRLQGVLDALPLSPAFIRTQTWDVVGWNKPASLVFTDYDKLKHAERNIMRLLFLDPEKRAHMPAWSDVARSIVASFRADIVRAGATDAVKALVDELCEANPEFKQMWEDNHVVMHGEATKQIRHPVVGLLCLDVSSFSVEGRPDLSLVIYNPASEADADKIRELLKTKD
ncbi:MAG TPA: helix-turn-helix transcriptional regulator [Drouetiella sp.]